MPRVTLSIDATELLEHTLKAQAMVRTLRLLQEVVPDHPEGTCDTLGAMAAKAEALGVWLEELRPAS